MRNYGLASYWDGRYLSYPPRSDFVWYCEYDALNPIHADHCYLPAKNKLETTSDEDSNSNYDNNKGGDGRI